LFENVRVGVAVHAIAEHSAAVDRKLVVPARQTRFGASAMEPRHLELHESERGGRDSERRLQSDALRRERSRKQSSKASFTTTNSSSKCMPAWAPARGRRLRREFVVVEQAASADKERQQTSEQAKSRARGQEREDESLSASAALCVEP
jgi:hypothetical protein